MRSNLACFTACLLTSLVVNATSLNTPVAELKINPAIPQASYSLKDKDGFLTPSPNRWEIIGALGIANLRTGNSLLVVTSDEIDKLVQTNKNRWNTFAAQLGFGYFYYLSETRGYSEQAQWFPTLEPQINVYYLNSRQGIQGQVKLFEDATSTQISFKAPISSTRLMFDTALTVVTKNRFSLYAIGGIGSAWNRMRYSDADLVNEDPCFNGLNLDSNTHSNFAWEVGAGLMTKINNRLSVNLQYLYADLGKASSSETGTIGAFALPLLAAPHFDLRSQTVLLSVHIAV
ncbi:MAG: porin family protein [Tatlockia sp.]|nr:porin family protein [Tatlockia sp.]